VIQVCRYHDGERHVAALIKTGRTRLQAVVLDDAGVRVLVEPLEAARYCSPLLWHGGPYPLTRLIKHFRRIGRERGITAGAKLILEESLP
jgi:hypothetical protein